MTLLVPIMILGWFPVTLALFIIFPPRRAAIIALIAGWLFLPMATLVFPGFPDYTKAMATCLPVVLWAAILDPKCSLTFRPRLADLAMAVWCLCPLASSLSNGLGLYDGVSEVTEHILTWGIPYYLGRLYFHDLGGLRELALGIVVGGLIYIPFCLWEMRMAPTLHYYFYGFNTFRFATTSRLGGYRPVVFMQHGIALGFWMVSASLVILWLWRSRAIERLWGVPISLLACALLIVTVLCRSLHALLLLSAGLIALFASKQLRHPIVLVCLCALAPVYVIGRNLGFVKTDSLVRTAALIDEDRAISLYTRLYHEERLMEKAWQQPLFGWGGWARSRVYDEAGEDTSITDGLWIIVFGENGLVGLISLAAVIVVPAVAVYWQLGARGWMAPCAAPAVALAALLCLYPGDLLMNGMVNPIYMVAVGGCSA